MQYLVEIQTVSVPTTAKTVNRSNKKFVGVGYTLMTQEDIDLLDSLSDLDLAEHLETADGRRGRKVDSPRSSVRMVGIVNGLQVTLTNDSMDHELSIMDRVAVTGQTAYLPNFTLTPVDDIMYSVWFEESNIDEKSF